MKDLKEHTTVFAVVLWEDPELPGGPFFLFVHNKGDEGKPAGWGLPGGSLEKGESPLDALRREAYGEAGLEIVASGLDELAREEKVRAKDDRPDHPDRLRFADSIEQIDGPPVTRFDVVTVARKIHFLVRLPTLHESCLDRLKGFFRKKAKSHQDEDGILVKLSAEEACNLGITETDEVDGIGLVAASRINEIAKREYHASDEEQDFYLSHLSRLQRSSMHRLT